MAFCVKCGSKLENEANFCVKCGAKVEEENKKFYENENVYGSEESNKAKCPLRCDGIDENTKETKGNKKVIIICIVIIGIVVAIVGALLLGDKTEKPIESDKSIAIDTDEENLTSENSDMNYEGSAPWLIWATDDSSTPEAELVLENDRGTGWVTWSIEIYRANGWYSQTASIEGDTVYFCTDPSESTGGIIEGYMKVQEDQVLFCIENSSDPIISNGTTFTFNVVKDEPDLLW